MIEELFQMHKNATAEALYRLAEGDFRGYSEAMIFAFKCKQFAAEIMGFNTVIGFDFQLPAD